MSHRPGYTAYVDDRYPLDGFYVRRPDFMALAGRLERACAALLEVHGYSPVLMPTLIPAHVIEAEVNHIDGFAPAVYWVTETGHGKQLPERLALAISSETVFTIMFRHWLADEPETLPLRAYQRRTVFRAEHQAVSPLLREREFLWFEAHTAMPGPDDCMAQIEVDTRIVTELCDQLGIPVTRTERDGDDRCPGALRTWGFDVPTTDGGTNQIASTHYLGQRFAEVFDLRLNGRPDAPLAHQTSFGIGLSRLVAAVVDHNPALAASAR
jgi:prolyl-tRNA synthetase